MMSRGYTRSGSSPSSTTFVVGPTWYQVCPLHTMCSISEGPMPRARQFKAPDEQVCESGLARILPGRARPSSATSTCEIPCRPTGK